MSDQPAPDEASLSAKLDAWSSNGTHDMTDVTHEAELDPVAATAETPQQADEAEQIVAEASEPTDAAADPAAPEADDPGLFLNELAQAMRTTAAAERTRIASDIDRRRDEHLAAIQTQRETEAQRIRDLAAEDQKGIDAWAKDERQRIDAERTRRAEALATDLETSLAQHGKRVDGQVERVEAAISSYRTKVDEFFAGLEGAADPVAIAQLAGQRPSFPDLAAATAADTDEAASAEPAPADPEVDVEATATATDDEAEAAPAPQPVGVMDPDAGSRLAASFAAWNSGGSALATDDIESTSASAAQVDLVEETRIPVAVARGGHDNGPGTVLHAVPSARPLSWLRRDRDGSGDSGDGR